MSETRPMNITELRDAIAHAEAAKANADTMLKILLDDLRSRVESEAAALFQAGGKQAGDITFIADGVKLKASISKTVKWDNDKLQAIASGMEWAVAQRIFDISFKVPEATFKAIPDPELVAKLEAARTVKYGELSIKPTT